MVTEMTSEVEPLFSQLADDPGMVEIVDTFIEELPDRVAKITDCVEKGDWAHLGELAHDLKGAGDNCGFPELAPFAQRLEWVVAQNDSEDILVRLADDLVNLCRRMRKRTSDSLMRDNETHLA